MSQALRITNASPLTPHTGNRAPAAVARLRTERVRGASSDLRAWRRCVAPMLAVVSVGQVALGVFVASHGLVVAGGCFALGAAAASLTLTRREPPPGVEPGAAVSTD